MWMDISISLASCIMFSIVTFFLWFQSIVTFMFRASYISFHGGYITV